MDRLKDKVALVFGAGSVAEGMSNGKATAIAYSREGAKIFAVDLTTQAAEETAAIIRSEGGECDTFAADVTSNEDVQNVVAACMARYGRIDILHNNVGGPELGGPVELSLESWDRNIDLNLKGLFLSCKHVLPIMERQGNGAIVNISSIASQRWLGTAYIAYSSSKAAVNQFTQSVALQYASKGIRANAILPGMMDTPIARVSLASTGESQEAVARNRHNLCPTGAMGDPWDIAWASVFLASDEAKYITGITLPVDGGLTAQVGAH